MIGKLIRVSLLCVPLLATSLPAWAELVSRADFIARMSEQHGFDRGDLTRLFRQVKTRRSILRVMDRPGEAKPWHEYRKLFLTPQRIVQGVKFQEQHRATLDQARRQYGVPPELVTAIIGVETIYGANTGGFRVIDALNTLAFHYPRRADFFRDELEAFLLLTREENVDPLEVQGSYAGAIGPGQFMPGSFRRFAVDFDGDGQRNLWNDMTDVIGSVANYLRAHGWQPGRAVLLPVQVRADQAEQLLALGLEPTRPLSRLRELGLRFAGELPAETPGSLIALESEAGTVYWLALKNYYVITRYNRSTRYATAVWHLAENIRHKQITGMLEGK